MRTTLAVLFPCLEPRRTDGLAHARLAVLLSLLGACAGTEPGELSVLDSSQTALHSGDAISLIAGAQGGYHADLLLAGPGLASGPATVDLVATGQDDEDALSSRIPLRLKTDGDLTISDHPILHFLCPGPVPIDGSAVRFRWLLTDKHGAQLETELDLSPTCPPGDRACAVVCSAGSR